MRLWFGILFVVLAGCIEPPPSQTVPNPDMDAQLDAEADAEDADDAGADMETPPVCVDPEDDMSACERLGIECGSVVIMDQCTMSRPIQCGGCDDEKTCLAAGVCDDPEIDDPTFCATNRFCGGVDRDGRMVECGDICVAPETCGAVTPNRCGCQGESPAEYCTREGLSCGQYQFIDSCNVLRVANCPSCVAPLSCGGGGQAGVCGCTPQTDAQICALLGKTCDNLTNITDNCGATRPVVDCGMCTPPQTCGGGTSGASGVQNVCGGEGCTPATREQFCLNLVKNCGQVSGTDNCNETRTEFCGTCTSPNSCGGGGTDNVCGCTYEGNLAFCTRYARQCGQLLEIDNCGMSRAVMCGPCPTDQSCTPAGTCQANCIPEDDVTFCTRLNACAQTAAMDNCGLYRTRDCGACSTGTCTNGKCGGVTIGTCNGEVCIPPAQCQSTDPPHCCDPNGPACR